MKITGTRSTITFDLENGFHLKAQGELLTNKKFVVYKDSMTQWEPPHENLPITQREIEEEERICFVCISRAKSTCVLMRSIYYNIPTKDNRIWHKLMEESRFWARLYNKYNKG